MPVKVNKKQCLEKRAQWCTESSHVPPAGTRMAADLNTEVTQWEETYLDLTNLWTLLS